MGRGNLDDLKQDGLTSSILVEAVWNFVVAKCSLRWRIERSGDLILNYTRKRQGIVDKEEKTTYFVA